jgi:hypothetical protein
LAKFFALFDRQEELTETRKHNRELQRLLMAQLKASAERESNLIACLDRVVQSRFDAPLMPKPSEQPDNGSLFPVGALGDVLSIDDDREFLERVNAA